MDFKRQKIESIAKRNNLLSIFSNKEKYNEVRAELFDDSGKPKFHMTDIDVKNYYSKGNDFQYNGGIWTLDEICDNGDCIIYSKRLERFETVKQEEICRII